MVNEGEKKILVVEDETPMAKALAAKLERSGYVVKIAGNGEEALAEVAAEKYDLIILDLVMPKADGWEVLAKLKADGNQVPVIIASNLSQAEDEERARKMGAEDFLVKSNVPLSEIVERVKKLL